MNSFLESQIPEPIADLDPVAYWRLDEIPRFPVTPVEWHMVARLPDGPKIRVVGQHAFDLVVNRKARRPVANTVGKLLTAFREDFVAARDVFEPVQWRMLFYLDLYPVAALGTPSFDPHQAFQRIYDQTLSNLDVPKPWTGATESAEVLSWDIRARISDTAPDVAKAAYVILAFARSLGLEKYEVLQVPFWETWWIERCLALHR